MDLKENFDVDSSDESLGSEEEENANLNGKQSSHQAESDSLLDSSDSSDVEAEEESMEVDEDAVNEELQKINDQLATNPYSYDLYVEKINILKKLGDLDKLRKAREKFRELYPLSEQLWLAWLKDEIKIACTEEEINYVLELFESAVSDYLSVNVWLEYINFCISQMDSEGGQEKCRVVFERALGSCGLHVSMGSLIWDMYRDFEAAILGTTTTEEQQKLQENRFITLCRRQLSVPLLGMTNTYEDVKTKIDIDENTESSYHKALSKLKSLENWEAKLVKETSEKKVQTYREYIEDEKKSKSNPARIQCLYERAVADFPLDSSIWLEYLDYLSKHLKINKIVLETASRAVRNCTWDVSVWVKYMNLTEIFAETKDVLESMKSVFEKAIVYCSSGEQAGTVWIKYLEFLRRKIDPSDPPEKELGIFKKTFVAAEQHLLQLLAEPNEYISEILLFRARFEAQCTKTITEEVVNLWRDIMSRGYGQYAKTWMQYILQETMYGNDIRKVRSLYIKAVSQVQDDLPTISNLWINFERDNGDLSSLEQCEARISTQMAKRVNSNYFQENQSNVGVVHSNLNTDYPKGKKRKGNEIDNKVVHAKKVRKADDAVDSDTSNSQSVFKVPPIPVGKPRENVAKHGESVRHDPGKDNRTVFLSNLAYTTGEKEIKEFFKEVGEIEEIRLAKDFKGRSKGFGYVFFFKIEDARSALGKDRQPLGGRPAFVSKCDPDKSTRQTHFKYPTNLEKNKLFIKGLPFSLTVDELKDMFKVHGDIKDCRLVTYRNGHSKGLAFVEYIDELCASKAILEADGKVIDGKAISVQLSNPPARDPSKSSSGSYSKSSATSSDQLQRRAPKAFVPRSLQINAKTKESDGRKNKVATSGTPKSNQDFRNMFFK